jgi:hypothetical protein
MHIFVFFHGLRALVKFGQSIYSIPVSHLSGIEHDEPLGSLLVHDAVAALTAPDRVAGTDLVLAKNN